MSAACSPLMAFLIWLNLHCQCRQSTPPRRRRGGGLGAQAARSERDGNPAAFHRQRHLAVGEIAFGPDQHRHRSSRRGRADRFNDGFPAAFGLEAAADKFQFRPNSARNRERCRYRPRHRCRSATSKLSDADELSKSGYSRS